MDAIPRELNLPHPVQNDSSARFSNEALPILVRACLRPLPLGVSNETFAFTEPAQMGRASIRSRSCHARNMPK